MGSDSKHADPKKQPLVFKAQHGRDIEHHRREWTSGTRGGGTVPKDFKWAGSPKQHQEEAGAGSLVKPPATKA